MSAADLPHWDPQAPLDALGKAGVSYTRTATNNRVRSEGADIAGFARAGERFEFTLPSAARVQAAFAQEGMAKKLLKLFKDEPQVGDAAFDEEVYIATSHPDSTQRFLSNDEVRELIVGFVHDGGEVVVKDRKVIVHAVTKGVVARISEPDIAKFVCHVMAFES